MNKKLEWYFVYMKGQLADIIEIDMGARHVVVTTYYKLCKCLKEEGSILNV